MKTRNLKTITILLLCFLSLKTQAQYQAFAGIDNFDSTLTKSQQRIRLGITLGAESGVAAAGLTGLYFAWYRGYNTGKFHFFNDIHEWCGMDKFGHAFSTCYIGSLAYKTARWSGMNKGNALVYGTVLPWSFMLGIEILDGFSDGWGFSAFDVMANTVGSAVFLTQQILWNEQRFSLKYSYFPSPYPKQNPGLLGANFAERMLKDYNGQTYWLSCNLNSFIKSKRFPNWINVCVGYSANGMINAENNPNAYSQFYLSLDVDLTKIPTKSKFLKSLFTVLNCFKAPFLALEVNNNPQGKNVRAVIR